MIWLSTLDYASVFVFALSGALVASRAQLDLIGFIFVAALTAVGGGTTRDLLLDRNPVFWIAEPANVAVAAVAAIVVFFTAHRFESRMKLIVWLDALALAIAVSAGVAAAQALGHSSAITIIMGVITGCMGGLLRDVVCNEVPLVLKQGELYVTAAVAGAAAATIALNLTSVVWVPLAACTVLTFTLRAGSIAFGWHIPVYKPRPPRM
ncbi:MAG: trimeric intracellular cation channel family protein [Pseudomonadota bacterium]